jgi:hypothetical protein
MAQLKAFNIVDNHNIVTIVLHCFKLKKNIYYCKKPL